MPATNTAPVLMLRAVFYAQNLEKSGGHRNVSNLSGDESPYSINIDNEKMGFLQNGVEIAYVQYNKMHINAIEAMDRMSVGTASDGGYFDFISTIYGMGVKWRAVAETTTRSATMKMAMKDNAYIPLLDEEGIFSVDFGGDHK